MSLSIFAFSCFIIPFVLYFKYNEKVWCKYYCPRASLFSKLLNKISLKLKKPKWLFGANFKKGVLIYFICNLIFIIMSTIAVSWEK